MISLFALRFGIACAGGLGAYDGAGPDAGGRSDCGGQYDPVMRAGATYEYRLADGGWAKFTVMEVLADHARTEMVLGLPGEAPARADTRHPCTPGSLDSYAIAGLPGSDRVRGTDSCVPEPPPLGAGVTWSCRREVMLDVDGRKQSFDLRVEGEAVDGGWVETPAGRWPTLRVTVKQEDRWGKVWSDVRWVAEGVGTVRSDEVELVAYHVPEQ